MAEMGVSSTFLSAETLFRRLVARGSTERGAIAMIAERDRHMIGILCFLRWGDTFAYFQTGWSPEWGSVELGSLLFNVSIKCAGGFGVLGLELLRGYGALTFRVGCV